MNGFDPKSSNISGQSHQQNQPQKTDDTRQVNVGGKKANVGKPKKRWLNKLISVLFGTNRRGRSSKSNATQARNLPVPKDLTTKATETSIRDRKTSLNEYNGDLLSPTPESAKPSNLPKIYSLDEVAAHLNNGLYTGSDNNLDKNLVKQHLQRLNSGALRPNTHTETYKSLPEDIQTLAKEVYAQKEVTDQLSVSPLYVREILLKENEDIKDIIGNELDRQEKFADRCSSAYKAIDQIPGDLNKNFKDIGIGKKANEKDLTEKEKKVKEDYVRQRAKAPKLKDTFNSKNTKHKAFYEQAHPKDEGIGCDIKSCAGERGHYVHANFVNLSNAPDEIPYIASQGPTEETIDNFARMIDDTNSRVSVCLVSKNELDPEDPNQEKRTVSLGPEKVGNTIYHSGVKIKLANRYLLDDGNVRIDKLEIDGKTHFRVYDTGWEDQTSGNPSRLAALSVLVEQLKQEPELTGCERSPVVVNCNEGVGRTGTFITLSKSTRDYLHSGKVETNLDDSIKNARKTRQAFVQTPGQYNVLKALHKDLPSVLDPLINAAGLKNQNTQTLPPEKGKAPAIAPKPKTSKKEPPAVAPKPITGLSAKKITDRYKEGYYHDLEEEDKNKFWDAIEEDIKAITSLDELNELESTFPFHKFSAVDEGGSKLIKEWITEARGKISGTDANSKAVKAQNNKK